MSWASKFAARSTGIGEAEEEMNDVCECLRLIQLNDREWASLIWIGLLVLYILFQPKLRSSMWDVVQAFFQWKIQIAIAAAVGWTAASVWLLAWLRIWQCDNLSATIIWCLTTMIVTLADTATSKEGAGRLRKVARETIAITAFVVFISELYTLPLWAELVLLPVMAVVAMMAVIAEHKAEHARLAGPLNAFLAIVGLGLIAFSGYQIVTHFGDFLSLGTARDFMVPTLLSLMYLPFLYLILAISAYENAAVRLTFRLNDKQLRREVYVRGFFAFGVNVDLINRYFRALTATDATDRKRIREAISEVRRIRRREKRPPPVDWSIGWSPYEAKNFLAKVGLNTEDYHRTVVDWSAESEPLKVNDSFLADRLTYRISGIEEAATKLSLELNANLPGEPENSETIFLSAAKSLIMRTLGDEPAERFAVQYEGSDEGVLEAGKFKIEWQRDEWGDQKYGGFSRRLKITHPSYKDPFLD